MPFCHDRIKYSLKKSFNHTIENRSFYVNIYFNNNDIYHGQWLNNQKHGYGKLINKFNRYFYEGEFFQNKKHGHGKLTIQLKDRSMQRYYIGQWRNDRMNGYGTLYVNQSAYYEGEFRDSKKFGWGKMYYENGDMYEGEWYNNKRHGLGLFLTVNGDRYEGHWFEDNKHGHGQYYFGKQKRLFEGLWLNNMCKSAEQIS
ncbi:unnamed protein product [Rotaria socialis]|uniref:MORN repeat-containing protein 3 n=2 Tax=Rotaria socialis TaxID=392032 RepID=A0A820IG66_9BILA|nr:unnamed protein product [Rotaria socialis]CAF3595155.1 unnamed protein product [Rotaria socialis]CAF3649864.1 unnamed protein product [Rotaria socialis]CAF4198116.1 unnamed protein product [Rotaria socialis]CAF4308841.1 unnamed protein product [Rotaria socialis]